MVSFPMPSCIILIGDVRTRLAAIASDSIHCVVTSPPYFGLRDYGCDGQIGLEATPDAYVAELVTVFREVRRCLRPDGTLWLNLGDSYAGSGKGGNPGSSEHIKQKSNHGSLGVRGRVQDTPGLAAKQRLMIPARVALALQADGWWLRDEIIWHKPNPMPVSVIDRTTPAHEMLYMFSKSARYHYDMEAIKEPATGREKYFGSDTYSKGSGEQTGGEKQDAYEAAGITGGSRRPNEIVSALARKANKQDGAGNRQYTGFNERYATDRPQTIRARELAEAGGLTDAHIAAIKACGISDTGKALTTTNGAGKNTVEMMALAAEAKAVLGGYYREFLLGEFRQPRSVWSIATRPFKGAHFATFPPDLVRPCILAGCPVGGTVLDPFFGAGTTGLVANELGRNAIGVELNIEYGRIAAERVGARALSDDVFGRVAA
jgi:DNA modification methylase